MKSSWFFSLTLSSSRFCFQRIQSLPAIQFLPWSCISKFSIPKLPEITIPLPFLSCAGIYELTLILVYFACGAKEWNQFCSPMTSQNSAGLFTMLENGAHSVWISEQTYKNLLFNCPVHVSHQRSTECWIQNHLVSFMMNCFEWDVKQKPILRVYFHGLWKVRTKLRDSR